MTWARADKNVVKTRGSHRKSWVLEGKTLFQLHGLEFCGFGMSEQRFPSEKVFCKKYIRERYIRIAFSFV